MMTQGSTGKTLAMLAAAAAMMESTNQILYDKTPRPRMDTSKSSTLSGKEQKRRKRRNKIASRSRKQNRR